MWRKRLILLAVLFTSQAILAGVWFVAQRRYGLETAAAVHLAEGVAGLVVAVALAWLEITWVRGEPSPRPQTQITQHIGSGRSGGIDAQAAASAMAIGKVERSTVVGPGANMSEPRVPGPSSPASRDSHHPDVHSSAAAVQTIDHVRVGIAAQATGAGMAIGIVTDSTVVGPGGQLHQHLPPPVAEEGQIVEGPIPLRPSNFMPRSEITAQLRDLTSDNRPAILFAVTGMAGVGKTMMAAARAWECQDLGWRVIAWIPAESRAQIVTGLERVARRLGLRGYDDDAETAALTAKGWLAAATERCLLVFDNAVDPDVVRPWIPATGRTQTLITTRSQVFSRLGRQLDVDVFVAEEAIRFLLAQTGSDDRVGAAELATELGYLALALAQAGALIANQRITFSLYLERLRQFPLDDYLPRELGGDYPASTAQTVMLSVVSIEEVEGNGAQELLELLAVLSPSGVPRSLLYPTGGEDQRPEIDRVLGALVQASLINSTKDGNTILVHRLVQRALRERATRSGRLEKIIGIAIGTLERLNASIPKGQLAWNARDDIETLVNQTEAVSTVLPAGSPNSERFLSLRGSCLGLLLDTASFHRAIQLGVQLSSDCERVLGADHPTTLASRSNLAAAYSESGAVGRAVPLHEQNLADLERVIGADHPDTLSSRNNLASAYETTGDLGRAIPLFERNLAARERVLGIDHPHTLISRRNLGYAYETAGDTRRAIPLFERTFAGREGVFGIDHPATLLSRNDLARAYASVGELGRAIQLFEQSLAIGERVLGSDHRATLASRNGLAGAYEVAGQLGNAISLYVETLAGCERVLGHDHPDTLAFRRHLAGAYETAGQLGRAIAHYEQDVADGESVFGGNHPAMVASRNRLAGAYREAGQLERAISLYVETLDYSERVLGHDHRETVDSRIGLALAYEEAGQIGKAIALFKDAVTDCERVFGANHPHTLSSRNGLAHAYQSAGDLQRAIPLYERTLADRQRVLGHDHPDTLASRNNLAGAYKSAGERRRAIQLYEQNLAEQERVLSADHPNTLSSRNNLAHAYKTAGDLERAIPLFERTLADRQRVLGHDHPDTLVSRINLASAFKSAGDLERAITLFAQTLVDCVRVLGPDHPLTKIVREHLDSMPAR